jgi:hypothetical protein
VRGAVDKLLTATKLDQFFTETAELVNGRAAVRARRMRRIVACHALRADACARRRPDDGHADLPDDGHHLLSARRRFFIRFFVLD